MTCGLSTVIREAKDVVTALCLFYNYRIAWILSNNKTVIKYENLVMYPEESLTIICRAIGVRFTREMLNSHLNFHGVTGHGENDLSRPIDDQSLLKWQQLSCETKKQIYVLTLPTMELAGYHPRDYVESI